MYIPADCHPYQVAAAPVLPSCSEACRISVIARKHYEYALGASEGSEAKVTESARVCDGSDQQVRLDFCGGLWVVTNVKILCSVLVSALSKG